MRTRVACVAVAIAVVLCGSVGSAQTAATLLQKGIYTHDTLGDLDAAIKIFEQVIAATPAGSELRTQAERRLTAAKAQRKWVQEHPQYASFDGRTYRHTWTETTFEVPEGFKLRGTGPSSDDGEMATFSLDDPEIEGLAVWMKKDPTAPDKLAARLDGAPVEKVGQRLEQGYAGYHIREGSLEHLTIGRQPAVFAIGDYVSDTNKRPMAEYLMWIYTEKNRVFFFCRMPADKFDTVRRQIDAIVQTSMVQ